MDEKTKEPPKVEFRCPDCTSSDYENTSKGIVCRGTATLPCTAAWSKKDRWQAFVLVRTFVSPTDFNHYLSIPQ